MILSTNHGSFTVLDLERSIAFYEKAFGFELVSSARRDPEFAAQVTGIPGADIKVAVLKCPGACMELIQYLAPPAMKIDTRTCNVGSAHVCFDVADVEAAIEQIVQAGGTLRGGPAPIPDGPNKGKLVAYMEDIDDNTIELMEAAK